MRSLQAKFGRSTAILLILSSVLLAALLDRMFHRTQVVVEENHLRGLVYSLISAIDVNDEGKLNVGDLPDTIVEDQHVSFSILNDQQKLLWSYNGEVSANAISTPSTGDWSFEHNKKEKHASVIAFGFEWEANRKSWKYTVIARDDGTFYRSEMHQFRQKLWIWLTIGCLSLLIMLLVVFRIGFQPLKKITHEIALIEKGSQHKFEAKYPAELVPLTANINSLLRHERSQQLRYQQALDNLAHAIKTPLTAIKNMSSENKIDSKELNEQVARIRDILDYQLRKASAVGKNPFAQAISISSVVKKITDSVQKVYAQKNIQFSVDIPPSTTVRMDEGDLYEVLGNIIENAAKYGKQNISIKWEKDSLVIEDDGPGFNSEQILSIVQRGVRQDQRTEGSGIGLSVAYEIISTFGGTMELSNSNRLKGAKITLKLL